MDVFLMLRREKSTIFLESTEETTVMQLKKVLEGIVKKAPGDIQLYKIDNKDVLLDNKTLGDCGFKAQNAKAQDPAVIGIAFRIGDEFEEGTIVPYSSPPELPDVMKSQEGPAPPTGMTIE